MKRPRPEAEMHVWYCRGPRLTSEALIARTLANYRDWDAGAHRLVRSANRKIHVLDASGASPFHVNVSRSGALAICAVSSAGPIGADIESLARAELMEAHEDLLPIAGDWVGPGGRRGISLLSNWVTVGDNANTQSRAALVSTDRRNDLALLKLGSLEMASAETKSLIKKLGIRVVPLVAHGLLRSGDVELGESVLVAGFPYGELYSNTIKVTGGMVSAVRGIGDDSGQFQMDAAAQSGNSGGPIYDENGNIVGVVVAQLNKFKVAKATGSLPENVNFGIKASTVRQSLTSSGLPSKWSTRSKKMSTKELAKIAQKQTLMVMCHR
jgi:hypothetical protein